MPAKRTSSRISVARDAANAAPIGGSNAPSAGGMSAAAAPAPAAASSSALVSDSTAHQGRPVQIYKVRNRQPFPKGDLYLDLDTYGSGYIKGDETYPEGGEGYPCARLHATIQLRKPGTSAGQEIGYINARLMKKHDEEDGTDFHVMCDDLSAELQNMSSVLFDEDLEWKNSDLWEYLGDILYIEAVFLKPRYRGYGVGLLAVNQLISRIPSHDQLVVIIAPCPLNLRGGDGPDPFASESRSEREHTAGKNALRQYYQSLGFRRLSTPAQEKRSALGLQLWGLWTGYVLPDIKQVVPHLF